MHGRSLESEAGGSQPTNVPSNLRNKTNELVLNYQTTLEPYLVLIFKTQRNLPLKEPMFILENIEIIAQNLAEQLANGFKQLFNSYQQELEALIGAIEQETNACQTRIDTLMRNHPQDPEYLAAFKSVSAAGASSSCSSAAAASSGPASSAIINPRLFISNKITQVMNKIFEPLDITQVENFLLLSFIRAFCTQQNVNYDSAIHQVKLAEFKALARYQDMLSPELITFCEQISSWIKDQLQEQANRYEENVVAEMEGLIELLAHENQQAKACLQRLEAVSSRRVALEALSRAAMSAETKRSTHHTTPHSEFELRFVLEDNQRIRNDNKLMAAQIERLNQKVGDLEVLMHQALSQQVARTPVNLPEPQKITRAGSAPNSQTSSYSGLFNQPIQARTIELDALNARQDDIKKLQMER